MDINIVERKDKPRVRWNGALSLWQARHSGHLGQGQTIDKAIASLNSAIQAARELRAMKSRRDARANARQVS